MNADPRKITNEINRCPDEIRTIENSQEGFGTHMEACAAANETLSKLSNAELIKIITTQSADHSNRVTGDLVSLHRRSDRYPVTGVSGALLTPRSAHTEVIVSRQATTSI